MNRKNDDSGFVVTIIVIGFVLFVGWIMNASTPKCIKYDCDNDQAEGSSYCYLHKLYSGSKSYKSTTSGYNGGSSSSKSSSSKSSSSSNKSSGISSTSKKSYHKTNSYSSYDDGYNDIYEDDDYDWDRYWEDDDYASGVDDAMDDLDW